MEKAYYKGWFKIHEVEVITAEKWRDWISPYDSNVYYKYLIKFKNGRLKLVHQNKLIL